MAWCKDCQNYSLYPEHHKCPPIWKVYFDGDDEEAFYSVYAHDPQSAAEQAAHSYDSDGEYYLCRGNSISATVRSKDGAESHIFEVSGETVPEYRAVPQPGSPVS